MLKKKNIQMLQDPYEKTNFNSDTIKWFFNCKWELSLLFISNEDWHRLGKHAWIKITGLNINVDGLSLTIRSLQVKLHDLMNFYDFPCRYKKTADEF